MNDTHPFRSRIGAARHTSRRSNQLLRLIRAAQPITRTEIAERLSIDKSTVTENVKPLIADGILTEETQTAVGPGRRSRVVSFAENGSYFIGVNLGVRRTQIGTSGLRGGLTEYDDLPTPRSPTAALKKVRQRIEAIVEHMSGRRLMMIGVSVPGMTDIDRRRLIFAPNLGWQEVDIASELALASGTPVIVENDATAAAMYEARLKIRESNDGLLSNFILIRSGTGIGVGLVIDSEVFRGGGSARGVAGEFGHMTIVAGGKQCVCGNRGCWEMYASAASAASLYMGDRPPKSGETVPRFVEIVARANAGELRSRRTLEKIGDHLGIGIANVIMGVGIPRVVISGRLVYAWHLIEAPMRAAIERSIIGATHGWSVEAGEPAGSAIGGAVEAAIEEYLNRI